MKKYAIYLRKSRADFDLEKEGKFETLARHKAKLLEIAEERNLNVVKIYKEIVSGETIEDRPEMQKLLENVRANKYDGVIVMEVERLARGATKDQGTVAEAFQYTNTLIVTPNKTYNPTNNEDMEYFEFGLFMSRREYKTIRRRLIEGKMSMIKQGNYFAAKAPFGYDIVKIKKSRTLAKNEMSIYVEQMFDMFVNQNLNCGEIAKRLNSMNVLNKDSKGWTRYAVRVVLQNVVYIGKISWGKRKSIKEFLGSQTITVNKVNIDNLSLYEGKHEGFIDEEIFKKAQTKFKHVSPIKHSYEIKNILAGLLKCSKCGYSMNRKNYGSGEARYVHGNSFTCKAKSISANIIINAVIDELKKHIENFEIELSSKNTEEERIKYEKLFNTMSAELKKIEKRRDGLFDKYDDGDYTREQFLERKERYTSQILELNDALDNLQPPNEEELEEQIVNLTQILDTVKSDHITPIVKNQLLKDIIERIDYTNENNQMIIDVYFKN